VEVRALEVGHGLKTLLSYGVLLIPNREKHDRQCSNSGEVVLAQGGESDVRHQLNGGVGLTADNVMDRLDCSYSVRFLSHKMGETC
jgi:hypothetical protein